MPLVTITCNCSLIATAICFVANICTKKGYHSLIEEITKGINL